MTAWSIPFIKADPTISIGSSEVGGFGNIEKTNLPPRLPITVIPVGRAFSGSSSTGSTRSIFQCGSLNGSKPINPDTMALAKPSPSGTPFFQSISALPVGLPTSAALIADLVTNKSRGIARFSFRASTSASFTSASLVRAVDSAACAESSAIRSFECLLSSAQCSSLISVVFTITNVESTPPNRLISNSQLAVVPTSDAVANDISEKGHIRIPDWFYIGGIVLVLVAGTIALGDQTRTLLRKLRDRRGPS